MFKGYQERQSGGRTASGKGDRIYGVLTLRKNSVTKQADTLK